MFYGTFSINRLNTATEVGNVSYFTNIMQLNNEGIQQTNKVISSLRPGLYGDDPVRLPQRGLSSQSLGK